jgi:ribosomal subunit interface protein
MKTVVSIPHHDYPAKVRDFLERRLQALLKYYDRIVSVRAVCERQSDLHRVELVANVGHHATLVVDARAEMLDRAIDEACSKMGRVLSRHRHKLEDRRRRGARTR